MWLDQRCEAEVAWLTDRVGSERIHRITGKPPDVAPVAYRIAWMLRHEEELFRRTTMFADVHAYLVWRLTGHFRTSWASADPLGLFDMERRTWSPEVLRALDLSPEQLPVAVRPGTVIGVVSESAANATSLRPDTPVVAGGGDGQAAGLGVNALGGDRGYLNLGTAVVGGVYSNDYRIGNAWRTMGACDGEGYYFETSLRTGTFLVDWFARHICHTSPDSSALLPELEAEAAAVPVGSNGLLALPYWGGAMTPYWDPLARGCWVGLSGSHRRGHLYRSLLEGIALEQALVTGMIEDATGVSVKDFSGDRGRGSQRPVVPDPGRCHGQVHTALENRGSLQSRGGDLCRGRVPGSTRHAADAAAAMSDTVLRETQPSSENRRRYADLLGIYRELYPSLRGTFAKLAGRTEG